jgi:hypothetical protein
MEIWNRKELLFSISKPFRAGGGLAFRAMPISARIVGNLPVTAVTALLHMAAKGRRSAHGNVSHRPPLLVRQRPSIALHDLRSKLTNDVCQLQPSLVHGD